MDVLNSSLVKVLMPNSFALSNSELGERLTKTLSSLSFRTRGLQTLNALASRFFAEESSSLALSY